MLQIIQSIYDLIGLNQHEEQAAPNNVKLEVRGENNSEVKVESPMIRTEQIFEKMDMDKNGVISEYEFINGCLQDKYLYQMLTADYSENY
jgi:hypothetical protein